MDKSRAEELFRIHSPFVYRLALMLTRSRTMADDVTQETFLRLYQKYDQYHEHRPLQPWLYRITLNVAKNMMRKQRWTHWFTEARSDSAADSPEQGLLRSERDRDLWQTILGLSLKLRQVIILRYYMDLSIEEIADTLHIPPGTCKSRLHLAMTKLRSTLMRERGQEDEEAPGTSRS